MGYIDFCSKCKYAYTAECNSNSLKCLQEKSRIMLELSDKNKTEDGKNNG